MNVVYLTVCRHIREHMKEYMDQPDELKLDNQEAMEFHYFKLHDYDNNNKLDGLELGAAMTHYEDPKEGEHGTHGKTHVSPLTIFTSYTPLRRLYASMLCGNIAMRPVTSV